MTTITTSSKALHTPLLGDENYDDEEQTLHKQQPSEKADAEPSSSVDKSNVDDLVAEEDDVDSILRYECFIFPFLLFVQFGLAFLRNAHDIATAATTPSVPVVLAWQNVSLGIVLLTATIWLYRGACADSKLNQRSWIFVFLPEILVNIILVLALLDKITMAYVAVLLGGLFLAILGFCATVHFMYCNKSQEQQQEQEVNVDDDDSNQYDLLIV
jgi:hypothetical protein